MNERLQVFNPPDLGLPSFSQERKGRGVKEEWWFEPHPLVLIQKTTVVGKGAGREVRPMLEAIKKDLYSCLAEAYRQENGEVWYCQGRRIMAADNGRSYSRPEESISQVMIINPVYLGRLPVEVDLTLNYLRQNQPPFFGGRSEDFKRMLRKHLPEKRMPLIGRPGRGICQALNVKNELQLHPNFTNLVFLEDQDGNIKNLPFPWQKYLGWSLMAKLGAFKNIIVPYQRVDDHLKYDLILNSLEGAHPLLSLEELPRRLMAFGSAQEMGKWEPLEELVISKEFWKGLPEIRGLMAFSRFCAEYNLLSPPVELRELVRGKILAKLVEGLAGYSRQAEGAFVAFVPMIDEQLNGFLHLPWTGFHIATISGKFGAVKTDLGEKDFAAIGAFFEGGKVGIIQVEGVDLRGPSIEAYELIYSQKKLVGEMSGRFLVHLREDSGGYCYSNEGPITASGIRAVFHGHRLYQVLRPDRVLTVPVSREEFPPFPCGSDKMHELSLYGMKKALERWEAGGRQAICAVLELPNHGSHLLFFWTADEKGIIPKDPVKQMKEVFEERYLLPIEEVKQG